MLSKNQYVEVAFPMRFNQTFTYRWSKDFASDPLGFRVLVPFQKRMLTGYVLKQSNQTNQPSIKDVQDVLDEIPVLTPQLIELVHYISDKYGASLGEALQTVIPAGLIQQTKKKFFPTSKEGDPESLEERSLLETIRKRKKIDWSAWKKKNSDSLHVLRSLHKNGWIEFETALQKEKARPTKKARSKLEASNAKPLSQSLQLTSEQEKIVDAVESSVRSKKTNQFLVHGVTGSGKTEVYLQATQRCLDVGRNVLALVPEISLTPQFLQRFQERFGEKIALLHSQRSETERVIEWNRILEGKARIVVGTRSSVFAPIHNIGLIIVDEEHDRSYKQDDHVMYHVKDVVMRRAETEKSVVLLGSATPSIETFHLSQTGSIDKRILSRRIHQDEMPEVEIVDLQKEKRFSESSIFSQKLKDAIESTLENRKQVILFLNRRGYSTHVYCPQCGQTLQCINCSISMTYHRETNSFQCHYCDFSVDSSHSCSTCGSAKWIRFGFGTEKVEKELSFLFPDAVVDRLDRDTARKKNNFDRAFSNFEKRKTDILIGTQMITKGLDFEHVDLVGVLLADQALNFPDFRAAENTFQLLTQVIGRSGRGKKRGKAILQTLQPHHYSILAAAKQDYVEFYEKEIKYREKASYPPFSKTVLFEVRGKQKRTVDQMAHWLRKQVETAQTKDSDFEVLGPSPAPIEKINANHRMHLFIKAGLQSNVESLMKWIYVQSRDEFLKRNLFLKFNIDPFDFM